jgi:hypothetical protein
MNEIETPHPSAGNDEQLHKKQENKKSKLLRGITVSREITISK